VPLMRLQEIIVASRGVSFFAGPFGRAL